MSLKRGIKYLTILVIVIVSVYTKTIPLNGEDEKASCFIYETMDELRDKMGDNSQSLFDGLWYTDARKLYHKLLPDQCIKNTKLNPCQRAEKAYKARKIAKQYVRERSNLLVSWSAKLYDFFRTVGSLDFFNDLLPILSNPNKWYDLFDGGDIISFWNYKLSKHLKKQQIDELKRKNSMKNKENMKKTSENGENNENNEEIGSIKLKNKGRDIDPEGNSHPGMIDGGGSSERKNIYEKLINHECFIDRNSEKNDMNGILWNNEKCKPVCEAILKTADKTNEKVDRATHAKRKLREKVNEKIKRRREEL